MKELTKPQLIKKLAIFGIEYVKDVELSYSTYHAGGPYVLSGYLLHSPYSKTAIGLYYKSIFYIISENIISDMNVANINIGYIEHYTPTPHNFCEWSFQDVFGKVHVFVYFSNIIQPPTIKITTPFRSPIEKGSITIKFEPRKRLVQQMAFRFCQQKVPVGIFLDVIKENASNLLGQILES